METFGIKAWAEADRPREKLTQKGKHTLTDSELLAILIRSGTRDESALELSRKILSTVSNDLTELSKMSVAELSRHKGVGMVKAITVVAALELGRRKREAEAARKINIASSKDVASLFEPLLADLPHEEFWLLMVNRANQVISRQNLSKGGVTGTVVDPKLIFKLAVDCLASGIVLVHNHPSGNDKPSEADIRLTKKIKDAGLLLDISVLDHIIIAGTSYYSFADSGMM